MIESMPLEGHHHHGGDICCVVLWLYVVIKLTVCKKVPEHNRKVSLMAITFRCTLACTTPWPLHQPMLALCCSRCWLVVVLLLDLPPAYCHCTPLCDRQCSCHGLLLLPIVNLCPQMDSSPAPARLCCSHCWLIVALLSAVRFCYCLVTVHC